MNEINRKCIRRFSVLTLLLFSIIHGVFSQDSSSSGSNTLLYFYGPTVETSEDSKLQLTTDLFYSQFQAEGDFTLVDRRTTIFDINVLDSHKGTNDILFYNEIKEDNDKWYVSLFLIDLSVGKEITVKYVYDEYYRVLIEAKDVLSDLLAAYSSDSQDVAIEQNAAVQGNGSSVSISKLFGTWKGEEHIDKIVILRGGKGFVIFENGASMNISITVEGDSLLAVQDSKSNASFFPELPREVALVKALDVNPIEWDMTIESENSLVGIKHTYVSEPGSNVSNIIKTEIPVKWYR